jgi:hypothetical protein
MYEVPVTGASLLSRWKSGREVWLRWMLAGLAGGAAGGLVTIPLALLREQQLLAVVPWSIAWIVMSVAEWLILRHYLRRPWRWVALTTVAVLLWGLPSLRNAGQDALSYGSWSSYLLRIMLIGLWLGVAQWLALRGSVRHALWWVPATIAASMVAILGTTIVQYLLIQLLCPCGSWRGALMMGLLYSCNWALLAAATGVVLVWLLRRTLVSVEPPRDEAPAFGANL